MKASINENFDVQFHIFDETIKQVTKYLYTY